MKFVILGFDGPEGQAKRKIHRPAHLANLEPLNRQGRVLLAGPFTDQAGSLIIIEASSSKKPKNLPRKIHTWSTEFLNALKSIPSIRFCLRHRLPHNSPLLHHLAAPLRLLTLPLAISHGQSPPRHGLGSNQQRPLD